MSGGGFCQAVGDWLGTAEVYGGDGRFLGNGVDKRHVTTPVDDTRVRIELSFTGPFSFAGHYVIDDRGDHRLYQGPINVGFAEALGDTAVQADNYWSAIGMTQRFLLMVAPNGTQQLSLALLSRGESLCYVVVGENHKQTACATEGAAFAPSTINRASVDVTADPSAGRGELLLHRPGRWHGTLHTSGPQLGELVDHAYEQTLREREGSLVLRSVGGRFAPEPHEVALTTSGWHAWTTGGPIAGSYSISGGRASSGQLHYLAEELRVWRREVVSHDGAIKAVVENWYRGGERIGTQHGMLQFEPA